MDKEELIKNIDEKLIKSRQEILDIINSKIEKDNTKNKLVLTNFWKIFEDNKTKILIPIIQRNYVQGNNENIRKKLIKDIFEAIKSEEKTVNLDIIYGIKDNSNFIPIDGQQRLTTLFLLYWYVFVIEDRYDLLEKIDISYENRASSKEFFELLKNKNKIQKILSSKEESISQKIRSSTDFYASKWNKDITIKSALNMLDEIEKSYKEYNCTYVSNILIDSTKDKIFFRCKFLGVEDNSDAELYIKMNSRGKKLSEYEILKSQLENIAFNFKEDIDYMKLCSNFDNKWADIFLKNANLSKEKNKQDSNNQYTFLAKVENDYYKFLKIFITYYFIENALKIEEQESKEVKEFKKALEKELTIKFDTEGIYKINLDFYKRLENVMNNIQFLYLNTPYENCNNIVEIMDLEKLWNTNIEKDDLRERLYFYSIIKYLERNQSVEELIKNYNFFENWIRVTRNYINSNYHIQIADRSKNKADSIYFNIIKNIQYLSKKLEEYPNIIEYFANDDENKNELDLSDVEIDSGKKIWLKTEIIKSKYMCNNPEQWTELIIEADKDEYFKGINYFLFEFIENENDIENFRKYQKVIKEIFKSGIKNDKKYETNKYLIQRAMLSREDYFEEKNNNIKTFYIFNHSDNTNTWIYGLNTEKKKIRETLKQFIDRDILKNNELNYERININNRLQEIIDEYIKENKGKQKSWRYYFVKDERLFNKCQDGNLKFIPEENKDYSDTSKQNINLINTQRNSKHWDYLNAFLEHKFEDIAKEKNIEDINIYYTGKTGDGNEFTFDNALKIIYQGNEYSLLREEDGKYKINLREDEDVYFSFNYNIRINNRENDENYNNLLNNLLSIIE